MASATCACRQRATLGGANSAATSRNNSWRKRQPSTSHGSNTWASSSSSIASSMSASVDQHRLKLAAVPLPSDDRRRANHRNGVRAGPQPGKQRLVQRLGNTGVALLPRRSQLGGDLFDIERDSVAARPHRGTLFGG